MGWMSCKNCIYFKACKEWVSKVGDKAIGFPYCKLDTKPCDLYISQEEYEYNLAKKFANEIKKHQYQSSDWSHGEHPSVIEVDDIDDVLLDMEVD